MKRTVQELLQERKEFTVAPIHCASYMLDPRFRGAGLENSEVSSAISFISDHAGRG